jgi:hypothetical protein
VGSPQLIPVVGHVFGQNGTYVSDVRIANPSTIEETAALVFTRSGEDGTTQFAMQQLVVEPGQTVALDDVVERTFHTFGTGTLAIHGRNLAVTSRTILDQGTGTLAQRVPARAGFGRDGVPLLVAPFPEAESRSNLGIAETNGGEGLVRIAGGGWTRDVRIRPWSHVQLPVPAEPLEVSVVEGTAAVTAYVSQVGPGGDAMYLEAKRMEGSQEGCFPAITSQTSGDPEWRSDVWFAAPSAGTLVVDARPGGTVAVVIPAAYEDVLATLFHRTVTTAALCTELPADVYGASRIVHGATTQAVPLLSPTGFAQQLLFVENHATHRTNIGVVSEHPVAAEVFVLDAAGTEIAHYRLPAAEGLTQISVDVPVTNGRAVVHFGGGEGSAYASVIDRRSGDATLFEGIDWRPVVP